MAITLQSNLYTPATGPISIVIPPGVLAGVASPNSTAVTPDAMSSEIISLALKDSNQHRKGMKFHPLLFKVAYARCVDMASKGYVGHKGSDGHYINWYLRQAGYKLPSWYGGDENNCESVAAGQQTALEAWNAWLNHPPHRVHVIGEDRFWADQIDFAIAHYAAPAGSQYNHYWVFVSART